MEYLLWAYFVLYPVYIYFTWETDKRLVLSSPEKRITVYGSTIVMLWLPVLVLMFVVFESGADMGLVLDDIGLVFKWDWINLLGSLVVFLLAAYFYKSLQQLKKNDQEQMALKAQMAYIRWFLPTNPSEYRWFIFGVSISAGICEEILFRGYLMHALGDYLPTYGAVIISSILFGLPHIYQGPVHVIRTALLGLIMALIYLATESLLVPILLHIVVDMYGGALAYMVFGENLKPKT
ncbi:CPBP family intramembrane glutamic endopeptidase [Psychrosphaera aestuarii]|uniref:CPBP family intramembrane glutamic endopeptidase n=1 Tax=Psychrosphaera aestuarii TaxID=1266052 RepID=UPI001B338C9C|nr:type II CAAX endopeptidase family protein [Psychrosphaera aestuarii]